MRRGFGHGFEAFDDQVGSLIGRYTVSRGRRSGK